MPHKTPSRLSPPNRTSPGPGVLTPKQERFVAEYVADYNGTQAAIRAGYSTKGADVQATRLLKNPRVAAALVATSQAALDRNAITADRVLQELALIAFADQGEVLDFSGESVRLRPAHAIPARARRLIQSIKVKRYVEGHGKDARDVEVTEFRLWSKDAALEKLGRYLGLWREGERDPAGMERLLALLGGAATNGHRPPVTYDA